MNVVVTSGLPGKGHNRSPLELSTEAIDDLFETATGIVDGTGVTSAKEEAVVDKLLDDIRAAGKEAEARRVAEKAPWDAGAKAVQAAWTPIIKKADLAADACKKALQPYRQRIADEKADEARKAAAEATAKIAEAQAAFRASNVANLEERAKAEALLDEAKAAEKVSAKAEKAATTGLGLRKSYRAEVTDMREFARFIWQDHNEEVSTMFCEFAQSLVNRGNHKIPGVTVIEERKAV